MVDDGILQGTTIDVEINEKQSQHYDISRDANFIYRLKFNNEYKFTFAKPGLYTRIILISTLVPEAILKVNSDFPPIEFQVNLYKEIEGMDKSFSFRPYAKISYDKKTDDFISEVFVNENMIAVQLDEAYAKNKEVNKEKKSLDKLELQELQEMQKEFDKIIREADGFFDQTRYDEALAKYQEANKLFPDRPYPLDRIREIQNVLDALKLAERKKQDINKAFKEIVDKADLKYQEKFYNDAIALYKQALQYKPDDNGVNRRISEIEQILSKQENERKFAETLAQAENLFNKKEYPQAREIYRNAANILPDDPRPNARIEEINRILQSISEQSAKEQNYQLAIQNGDKLFGQQKYNEAIVEYKKALDIIPNDQSALAKISDAENAIKQQENQLSFNAAIAAADKAFKQKDFTLAESEYKKALGIKPLEKYPKDQLDQIAAILAAADAEKYKNAQYAELVRSGDSLLNIREFDRAKSAFYQALKVSPEQTYPNKMILQINKELEKIAAEAAQRQQTEESYKQAIARADRAYDNKLYSEANQFYTEALRYKPGESYPTGRIDEINRILQSLAEQTANQENFQRIVLTGDRLAIQKKYVEAIAEYRKALEIKPNDQSVLEKITTVESAIKELNERQAYENAIAEADKAFKKKDYSLAESEYIKALKLRPQEKYPQDQIDQINRILASEKADKLKNEQYASLVRSGDSLLNVRELERAKSAFTQALKISPEQTYPNRMILQINKELEKIAAEKEAQKQIDQLYNQAIAKADRAFGIKQYEEAKLAYNESLGIKPNEVYPTTQIQEINRLVNEEKEKSYQSVIKEADRLFAGKEYETAITQYRKALQIKNGDSYCNEKISEATRLLEAIAAENARLKKLNDDYSRLISQANEAAKRNDLNKEKEKLTEALNLKPEETYPKNRIADINDFLEKQRIIEENSSLYAQNMKSGQEAFNKDLLEDAKTAFQTALKYKAEDQLALQRISEINQILEQRAEIARMAKLETEQRLAAEKASQEKFKRAVAEGDADFNLKRYNEARGHYVTALSAVPGDQYPKDKIKEIDNILDELRLQVEASRQKAIRDSIDNVREQNYRVLIKEAEQLASGKKYDDAIAKYDDAIEVWPEKRTEINAKIDQIKDQIRIAEKQLAEYKTVIEKADIQFNSGNYNEARTLYVDAGNIMPDAEYPKNQLKNIQEILKAKNSDYAAIIARADEYFNQQKWQSAKNDYIDALNIKPGDSYANSQLQIINQKVAQMLAADVEESLTTKAFNDMLKQAEESLAAGKLNEAKHLFEISKTLKPTETYPQQKIVEIEQKLEVIKADSIKLAQSKNEDDSYRQVIAMADQSFRAKSYDEAVKQYSNALEIKPGETYPQKQIDLIKGITNKPEPQQSATAQPVVADTKPVTSNVPATVKTSEYMDTSPRYLENLNVTEANKLYNETISKADELFLVKDYSVSRFYYYKASDIKPSEIYPKKRIEEIGRLIDDGLSAEVRTAYDNAIKQADDAFSKSNYTVAKFYYYKALEIKSWERYPKDRVHEIEVLTNSLLSEREERLFNEAIAQADEAYYAKNYSVARFHYNEALRINPNEQYPKIKIEDIRKLIEQEKHDQVKQEYLKQLQQADQAFEKGDYSVARFYYNKALSILKNEQYPKDQLLRIENQLSKRKE